LLIPQEDDFETDFGRPYGTEGFCSTLTQDSAALVLGYSRFSLREKVRWLLHPSAGRRSRWTTDTTQVYDTSSNKFALKGHNLFPADFKIEQQLDPAPGSRLQAFPK
jgi:hypothetical protein